MPSRKTVVRARQLRRIMTAPEVKLWAILRARPGGYRFRRQHPVGTFVLDFYCPAAKLGIEIDGLVHEMGDNPAHDRARDAWFAGIGIDTLRIAAADVMDAPDAVLRMILDRCASPLHRPSDGPPPHAGHGEDLA